MCPARQYRIDRGSPGLNSRFWSLARQQRAPRLVPGRPSSHFQDLLGPLVSIRCPSGRPPTYHQPPWRSPPIINRLPRCRAMPAIVSCQACPLTLSILLIGADASAVPRQRPWERDMRSTRRTAIPPDSLHFPAALDLSPLPPRSPSFLPARTSHQNQPSCRQPTHSPEVTKNSLRCATHPMVQLGRILPLLVLPMPLRCV